MRMIAGGGSGKHSSLSSLQVVPSRQGLPELTQIPSSSSQLSTPVQKRPSSQSSSEVQDGVVVVVIVTGVLVVTGVVVVVVF